MIRNRGICKIASIRIFTLLAKKRTVDMVGTGGPEWDTPPVCGHCGYRHWTNYSCLQMNVMLGGEVMADKKEAVVTVKALEKGLSEAFYRIYKKREAISAKDILDSIEAATGLSFVVMPVSGTVKAINV